MLCYERCYDLQARPGAARKLAMQSEEAWSKARMHFWKGVPTVVLHTDTTPLSQEKAALTAWSATQAP